MRRLAARATLGALVLAGLAATAASAQARGPVREGWTPMARCAPCGSAPQITDVQFADERTGWLAGSFGVARTTDGGATWSLGTGLPGAAEQVSFSGSRGVAAGRFEGLAVSNDGGATWKQYRPVADKVYDVQALPDRLLAVTGGTLFTSTDGGVVWRRTGFFPGSASRAAVVHFADATHGTAAAAHGVWTTHDGGATWGGKAAGYADVRIAAFTRDATTAFAGGVSGKGPSEYVLDRTTDGASFAAVRVPHGVSVYRGIAGIGFSGDTGYAVGWEGTLLRSTDAGATWVHEAPPPSYERTTFRGVAVLSPDRAIAVTYGGGLVTRDAPLYTDVSEHPYRGVGLGLLGLAGLSVLGAGVRAVAASPDKLVAGLAGVGVLAGAAGGVAVTKEDAGGVPAYVLAGNEPPGAGILGAVATQPPIALASRPATPTAAPTAVSPSATSAAPTLVPTVAPTVAPTTARPATQSPSVPATTAPTKRPTATPTATKPAGAFTASPATLSQRCSPNHDLAPFTITLKNTTSQAVPWTLQFDHANGEPWAAAQVTNGTLAPGASQPLTIYPNGQAACAGINGPTKYQVRVRHDSQGTVAGPVLATVTDTVSPA